MTSLREANHPYYCNEGNYFRAGMHDTYDSWAEFLENWGHLDHDLNLVFRWDWSRPIPEDYDEDEEMPTTETLKLFWVLQRKAILRSTECVVTPEDEPAIRAWLEERAKTIAAIWAPINLLPTGVEQS